MKPPRIDGRTDAPHYTIQVVAAGGLTGVALSVAVVARGGWLDIAADVAAVVAAYMEGKPISWRGDEINAYASFDNGQLSV
uniref:Uncharacterized protein n=1 Tax=Pristionchus pacificus TaxID=54126 RepID=A0A2A6D206_PRIPA|eukprot:PDM84428.1 hypothetical protein PRIPAC_33451 [Pristionchus pacificus]